MVVRCHGWKCAQQLLRCSHDDDTRDTGPRLHDSVIAQFKQRLLDYCSIKRPGVPCIRVTSSCCFTLSVDLIMKAQHRLLNVVHSTLSVALLSDVLADPCQDDVCYGLSATCCGC